MIFFSIFRETDNKYFSRTFTINLIPDRKQDKKICTAITGSKLNTL